jgi:hypothetical protein
MTAVALGPRAVHPTPAVVPALALGEARRLLTHPVSLLGFALWVLAAADGVITGTNVIQSFETIATMPSFFPGVPLILAAHMVATRDHRAGSLDVLGTTPGRAEERVWALCLASLAPALLALVLNVGLFSYLLADGRFDGVPSGWHIVQGPVTVLGACLLGTMLGVWAPALATPIIALVTMVSANMWLNSHSDTTALFGPAHGWADWGVFDGSVWVGLLPGSAAWHLVYLVGLCGMAGSAALIRVAERRNLVVTLGLVSVAAAVAGGLAQLP